MLNINELRETLSEVIHRLMNEEMKANTANAVVNASGKILSSIKLEMEYMQMIGKVSDIPQLTHEKKEEDPA